MVIIISVVVLVASVAYAVIYDFSLIISQLGIRGGHQRHDYTKPSIQWSYNDCKNNVQYWASLFVPSLVHASFGDFRET
jgi:hypothetical protein